MLVLFYHLCIINDTNYVGTSRDKQSTPSNIKKYYTSFPGDNVKVASYGPWRSAWFVDIPCHFSRLSPHTWLRALLDPIVWHVARLKMRLCAVRKMVFALPIFQLLYFCFSRNVDWNLALGFDFNVVDLLDSIKKVLFHITPKIQQ